MSMFSGQNNQQQQQQQQVNQQQNQPGDQQQQNQNTSNNQQQQNNQQNQQPGDQQQQQNAQNQQQNQNTNNNQQQQNVNQAQNTGFGNQQMQQQVTGFGGQDADGQQQQQVNPVDPNTYAAFNLPAHTNLNDANVQADLAAFRTAAAKRGMDQNTAQAALDLMVEMDAAVQPRMQQATAEQDEVWQKESAAMGLLTKESLLAANAGLVALDPKGELKQFFNDHGMMHHPVLIQLFAAFHAGRNKPVTVAGGLAGDNNQGSTQRSLPNILYPDGSR